MTERTAAAICGNCGHIHFRYETTSTGTVAFIVYYGEPMHHCPDCGAVDWRSTQVEREWTGERTLPFFGRKYRWVEVRAA